MIVDDLVPDGRGNDQAPADDCPVEMALSAVAGRWTTLILRDLSRGDHTYSTLAAALPAISDKVLADRLTTLVDRGLVARTVIRGYPNRTRYQLTAAGRALRPLLIELHATGTRLRALSV